MTSGSQGGRLLDAELMRLRGVWVHAYWGWTKVADSKASTSIVMSEEQHAALRAYHNAEAAYFTHRRLMAGE